MGGLTRPNDGSLQLGVDDGNPCRIFPLELVVAGELAVGQWNQRLRRARRVHSKHLGSRRQIDRPASVHNGVPKVDTAILLVTSCSTISTFWWFLEVPTSLIGVLSI